MWQFYIFNPPSYPNFPVESLTAGFHGFAPDSIPWIIKILLIGSLRVENRDLRMYNSTRVYMFLRTVGRIQKKYTRRKLISSKFRVQLLTALNHYIPLRSICLYVSRVTLEERSRGVHPTSSDTPRCPSRAYSIGCASFSSVSFRAQMRSSIA